MCLSQHSRRGKPLKLGWPRPSESMARLDDFAIETKELLAKRVGMRCSNPNCRQPTSGPSSNSRKTINIGVAAHITAASPGGPRYDASLSPKERRAPENGIWCCQNYGKLVDSDADAYPIDLLTRWKSLSEEAARLAIDSPGSSKLEPVEASADIELIRFYSPCFSGSFFARRIYARF